MIFGMKELFLLLVKPIHVLLLQRPILLFEHGFKMDKTSAHIERVRFNQMWMGNCYENIHTVIY